MWWNHSVGKLQTISFRKLEYIEGTMHYLGEDPVFYNVPENNKNDTGWRLKCAQAVARRRFDLVQALQSLRFKSISWTERFSRVEFITFFAIRRFLCVKELELTKIVDMTQFERLQIEPWLQCVQVMEHMIIQDNSMKHQYPSQAPLSYGQQVAVIMDSLSRGAREKVEWLRTVAWPLRLWACNFGIPKMRARKSRKAKSRNKT